MGDLSFFIHLHVSGSGDGLYLHARRYILTLSRPCFRFPFLPSVPTPFASYYSIPNPSQQPVYSNAVATNKPFDNFIRGFSRIKRKPYYPFCSGLGVAPVSTHFAVSCALISSSQKHCADRVSIFGTSKYWEYHLDSGQSESGVFVFWSGTWRSRNSLIITTIRNPDGTLIKRSLEAFRRRDNHLDVVKSCQACYRWQRPITSLQNYSTVGSVACRGF
ncbi:hypothetical protein BDV11DRAFT_71138 [Aspergillus similis]